MHPPATVSEIEHPVRYDCHIHVKVTEELGAQAKAAAARKHKKVSEFLRDLIRDHLAGEVAGGLNWFGGSSSMSMGSLADLGDGSGLRVANGGSASSGGFGDMMSSGAGGIAASLGSLLSSINGRGGKITSTLGGLGGQIGSMFGPIGSLIGGGAGIGLGSTIQGLKNGSLNWLGAVTEIFPSFLPFGEILAPLSLLGINPFGLFGHTPLSAASFTGGGLKASDGFGGLKPKVSEGLVKSLFKQLEGFADQIDGGLDEDVFGGIIGQRGKKFFYQPQDSKLGSAGKKKFGAERFKTAEEAHPAIQGFADSRGAGDGGVQCRSRRRDE